MRVGGATSELDLPSLTPLPVAACGRLQRGVPHWTTSVDYCNWLIIDPTFCGSIFSTGRLLAIEDVSIISEVQILTYRLYPVFVVVEAKVFLDIEASEVASSALTQP